jgi:hypothetical protein
LHGTNQLTKQTALSEKGEVINGRGDSPTMSSPAHNRTARLTPAIRLRRVN